LRRITNREMSIPKAIRVRKAARKERNVASRASMTCEENENRKAIKVTTAATGCTARPRVAPGPIVTMLERDTSSTA